MKNSEKTKEQLITEIKQLESKVIKLEESKNKHKMTEETAEESEQKFKNMVMNLMEGFYSVTLDGKLLEYNNEFVNILGLDPEKDYIGLKVPDFWQDPSDRKVYLDKFLKNGIVKNYIINAKKSNGDKILTMANARLIKDKRGEPLRIEGTFLDVTERKKSEEKIRAAEKSAKINEEYYRNIINKMGDPVFVKDNQSRFLLVNDAFCKMLGLTRNDIINKTLAEHLSPEEMKHFLKVDEQVLIDGKDNVIEEPLTTGNNKTLTISTRKTRFIDDNDKRFLVGVIRDVTERKQAEEELAKHRDKLEELVKERTAKLEEKNKELDTTLKVFVGRELKIKELETKINAMRGE